MNSVRMTVNGRAIEIEVPPHEVLMDTLRERLGLTGTKEGCREGECGACTVLIDDKPVDSCLYPTRAADGRRIETVEGLDDPVAHAVQTAFVRHSALQCGYCTPGFVTIIVALLRSTTDADAARIQRELRGNLCRCTGYAQIIDAALAAQAMVAEERS